MGFQDIIENIKYADAELKKKIILGSVAGVLFVAAGAFLLRGLFGQSVEEVPTEIEQAANDLRDRLQSEPTKPSEYIDDGYSAGREAQTLRPR